MIQNHEGLWRETITNDFVTERDLLRGGLTPQTSTQSSTHDIQVVILSTAESWMHIQSKFDGGKVINRPQSGSWGHRSMGAGLKQNMDKEWGPKVWKNLSPTKLSSEVAEHSAKKARSES